MEATSTEETDGRNIRADNAGCFASSGNHQRWKGVARDRVGQVCIARFVFHIGTDLTNLFSLTSMTVEELLVMATSPISSHILDAALTNPTVDFKWRRKLLMAFMGHYLELATDKLGSRVADTIWDRAADGFTKVSQGDSRAD
jgi:hypothetical protein